MDWKECVNGVQHLGIPTNDMEETITFYGKLGFDVVYRSVIEETGEKVAFLQLKNLLIETYENHAAKLESGAVDHIAIDVKDIEEAYELVKSRNLNQDGDSIHFLPFWEKGVRFFTIEGPNKERIEFNQRVQ